TTNKAVISVFFNIITTLLRFLSERYRLPRGSRGARSVPERQPKISWSIQYTSETKQGACQFFQQAEKNHTGQRFICEKLEGRGKGLVFADPNRTLHE